MAWTSPMTAVTNATFTAAQFNTHVRDNLLETAPAKATTIDRLIVANGANAIREQPVDKLNWSTSWGNLTVGDGSLAAEYRIVSGIVVWRLSFTFGSTSSVSAGTISFTLPFTPTGGSHNVVGQGYVRDNGTSANNRLVTVRCAGGTTAELWVNAGIGVTNTSPFTWAVDDRIAVGGAYLASTDVWQP